MIEKTRVSLMSLGVSADSKLLVAVSGGPDSLALAHVLQSLREGGTFAKLMVAHVNHGIREEAKEEEIVLRKYCAEWDVPIEVKHVQTRSVASHEKKGIEETARKQRYEFFGELLKSNRFDFALTAHTANDQAETVLMNLIRGTGARGLSGIPPKRKLGSGFLIRPWLSVTRDEILVYIREHDLLPVYDRSNDELSYQRNRVRHKVMPVLAEAWPDRSPVRALVSLAERMKELSGFLDHLTEEKLHELQIGDGLSLEGVLQLRGFELHAVMEAWIAQRAGHYMLTSRETERICGWLNSEARAMQLRRGVQLKKRRKLIEIKIIV